MSETQWSRTSESTSRTRRRPDGEGSTTARRPLPPSRLLARHGARVLDPLTAVRLPGRDAPLATAYRADRIVVGAGPLNEKATRLVHEAAAAAGLVASEEDRGGALARLLDDPGHKRTPRVLTLAPDPTPDDATRPFSPPDAWTVLQHARALAGGERVLEQAMGLDHVLMGTDPDVGGTPFTEGHGVEGEPFTEGHGVSDYGRAGSGGRQPVSWIGADPPRTDDAALSVRRPVVAVLDTGCGRHPWLDAVVRTDVRLDGVPAGLTDPATDPETSGDLTGPLDAALDSHSGHGTFICGLLHQLCPDADLLAVRVMASDGVVLEGDLLHALAVVQAGVARWHDSGGSDGFAVDVVVLSLGYYHEEPDDASLDTPLLAALTALGELGVAVVAAAGNGATAEPMYPAAFTPHAGGPVATTTPGCVPVTSVAATNPDGTVALFSNAGAWISCWHPGAALVSTMPPSFRGGRQPSVAFDAPDGTRRASLDPDDFGSGFGVWSGTSFAGPVMAGRLARRVAAGGPAGPTARAAGGAAETADTMAALVAELVAEFSRPGRTG